MRTFVHKFSRDVVLILLIALFACKNKNVTLHDDRTELISIDKENENSVDELKNINENVDILYEGFKIITFGTFEQDGNVDNGKEKIKWLILEDDGEKRTLLSQDVLYAMPFDDKVDFDKNEFNQSYEKSSLRKWLNEDFFDAAFNKEEKKFVTTSKVKNGNVFGINNSTEPIDMGADTEDKVYILSKDEIRRYLGFENEAKNIYYQAKASNYANKILDEENDKENIAVWHKEQDYEEIYGGYAEYWIRSSIGFTTMNANEYYTNIVDKRGHISNHGFPYYVERNNNESIKKRFYSRGVRPVIKIAGTSINEDVNKNVKEDKSPTIYDIKEINNAYIIDNYDRHKTYRDFDSVVLGTYEQDGDITNGKESIEWLILKKDDDRELLISKYILDYVEYSNILERYTVWKDSRLRAWANNEFYDGSFNEKEKVLIMSSKNINYDNPVYGNTSGPLTIDKIFVPSFDELLKGFNIDYNDCIREPYYDYKKIDDERLETIYTDYALKKYRKEKNNNKATPLTNFWLRNQGRSGEEINTMSNSAMTARNTIDLKGSAYDLLQYFNNSDKEVQTNPKLGFRPCMWIDLKLINEFEGSSYDEKVDKIFSLETSDSIKHDFENISSAKIVTSYNNKATIANYDTVTFGKYEQDNATENGKEDIEWIVLDKKDDEYLLLSKYVLDYCEFYKSKPSGLSISWNNSEIRAWANTEFLGMAFTEDEKKFIISSKLDNTKNDYYNLSITDDKIFLLSIDEIIKYFGNKNENYDGDKVENLINANDKTRTFATSYAGSRGVVISSKDKMINNENVYSCGYYTRSMRNTNYNQVFYIKNNGADGYVAAYDSWKRHGFRPAIWVKKAN